MLCPDKRSGAFEVEFSLVFGCLSCTWCTRNPRTLSAGAATTYKSYINIYPYAGQIKNRDNMVMIILMNW